MELLKVLKGLDYQTNYKINDCNINTIQYDSRKITYGDVFVCIRGFKTDGHIYIEEVVRKGAKVIIGEIDYNIESDDTIYIKVNDSRKALAIIAANYYGNPSAKLKLIGITGTNGKTTTSYYLKSILENNNYKVGLIGTISNFINGKEHKSIRTTPESLDLHKLFRDMVDAGCEYCIMEVSSHSLELERVYGCKFDISLFTNITLEHLDFHENMNAYFNAKLKLLLNSKKVIFNNDIPFSKNIYKILTKKNISFKTFGIEKYADYKLNKQHINHCNNSFEFNGNTFTYNMPGLYNAYNALSAISIANCIGLTYKEISKSLKINSIPGRFEVIKDLVNTPYNIVIDFAHTPDGLEKLLTTARNITKNRIISVYGCGGDKNKKKRAELGKVGTELSDYVIVTSDNPRDEEPMNIINDIVKGIKKSNYKIIENRYEAIKNALSMAKEGDMIVLAGKGHETTQITNNGVIPFNEKEIVKEILMKK